MNNEPVAWKHKPSGMIFDEIIEAVEPDDLVPLYTHPHSDKSVKAKTLTDEEILEVAKEMGWRGALGFLVRFARAILKKASEK